MRIDLGLVGPHAETHIKVIYFNVALPTLPLANPVIRALRHLQATCKQRRTDRLPPCLGKISEDRPDALPIDPSSRSTRVRCSASETAPLWFSLP